jgi:hypothetical protein
MRTLDGPELAIAATLEVPVRNSNLHFEYADPASGFLQ